MNLNKFFNNNKKVGIGGELVGIFLSQKINFNFENVFFTEGGP